MSETGSVDGWNGDEAQHWVTEADRYDGQLAPFSDLLFDRIQLAPGETVLDVGCGCGATTIGAARLSAVAVGIDLSVPMLAVGRQRARMAGVANIEFVADDAAHHQFAPASFDAIVSRFGVMFFDDPVMALTNLCHALERRRPIGVRVLAGLGGESVAAGSGCRCGRACSAACDRRVWRPGNVLARRSRPLDFGCDWRRVRRDRGRVGEPDDHAWRWRHAGRDARVPARHRDRPRLAGRGSTRRGTTGDRRGQRSPGRVLRTRPWGRTRNGCLAGQRLSLAVSLSHAWKPPTRSVARCSPTSRSNAAARLDW